MAVPNVSSTDRRTLIIGYGSAVRSDDAVGHHVVDALRKELPRSANAQLVQAHQLDVTMAEEVASCDLVIFVDASVSGGQGQAVVVEAVVADQGRRPGVVSHALTPAGLLGVAKWLYGREPEAFLIAIAVDDISLGEELSAAARSVVPEAARVVMGLLNALG